MTYTINTGLLTALDVMAGLICVLVAPRTQIGNFFMLILPDCEYCSWRSLQYITDN
jgi:hypothetical protein